MGLRFSAVFFILLGTLSSIAAAEQCCFIAAWAMCTEGYDELDCDWYMGDYYNRSCSDVAQCDHVCCCHGDSHGYVLRGVCDGVYGGTSHDAPSELCEDICSGALAACSSSCLFNENDCLGADDIVPAGSYYCWENDAYYDSETACNLGCFGSCDNGMHDGDETDVDCGGSCEKCAHGKSCLSRHDCLADYCNANSICGCLDFDEDGHQDIRCGGDDCNDYDAAEQKCPILLVHGYWIMDPNVTWSSMGSWLESFGYDVHIIDLETVFPTNDDIRKYSKKVDIKIKEILESTGASKVDIIGHSMGGLVSRWYTRFGYKGDVRNLIMLGTPNHGSELFYVKYDLSILSKILFKLKIIRAIDEIVGIGVGAAGKQMTPNSVFLNTLNYGVPAEKRLRSDDIINGEVSHHTFGGTDDCWLTSFFLYGEDDCLVRLKSVELDNLQNKMYPVNHGTLVHSADVFYDILGILEGDAQAVLMPDQQNQDNQIQEAAYIGASISGGYNLHDILIGHSNASIFLLSWYDPAARLKLNLVMPNGTLLNSSREGIEYNPANHSANETFEGFIVQNPVDGVWQAMVVHNNGSTDYTAIAMIDSSLRLNLFTDKHNYHRNENIIISANVTNHLLPIASAVEASIRKPNEETARLSLYDDGMHDDGAAEDGLYANSFADTSLKGIYEITAKANGSLESISFIRQANLETEVFEPFNISVDALILNATPSEKDRVQVSALVFTNAETEDTAIKFYDDSPGKGKVIYGQSSHLSPGLNNISFVWNANRTTRYIYVLADSFDIMETDYSDNQANERVHVRPVPACYADIDCGVSGLVDERYCSGDKVYRDNRSYECIYPGTMGAYCNLTDYPVVMEDCSYKCRDGICLDDDYGIIRFPDGIYEPLCCPGGGGGCSSEEDINCDSGDELAGTHINTFYIIFDYLKAEAGSALSCRIEDSAGELFEITTALNSSLDFGELGLSYTLKATDNIDKTNNWLIKNCRLTHINGTVHNYRHLNRIVYVHENTWTRFTYWYEDGYRALQCYLGIPDKYFENTVYCDYEADVNFALRMSQGTPVAGNCHGGGEAGCSEPVSLAGYISSQDGMVIKRIERDYDTDMPILFSLRSSSDLLDYGSANVPENMEEIVTDKSYTIKSDTGYHGPVNFSMWVMPKNGDARLYAVEDGGIDVAKTAKMMLLAAGLGGCNDVDCQGITYRCPEGDEAGYLSRHPAAADPYYTPYIGWSNSCVDEDYDGYGNEGEMCDYAASDCNDSDEHINPGAEELCDGIDNDCDGHTDEGCQELNITLHKNWNLFSPIAGHSPGQVNLSLSHGWNLIGYSGRFPFYWSNIIISNSSHSMLFGEASGMIQPILYYFDSNSQTYKFVPDDDEYLREGKGYWLYSFEDSLTLGLPEVDVSLESYEWSRATVHNGSQTMQIMDATAWLQPVAYYYDGYYRFVPGDSDYADSFTGYWLFSNSELTLNIG